MTATCIVPTIFIADIAKAVAYYRDVFGFALDFEWGDPVFYAGMTHGGAAIHLNASSEAAERRGKSALYLVVSGDIQALYEGIMARGGTLVGNPPQRYAYGMIDFKCVDPDGNWVSFGQDAP